MGVLTLLRRLVETCYFDQSFVLTASPVKQRLTGYYAQHALPLFDVVQDMLVFQVGKIVRNLETPSCGSSVFNIYFISPILIVICVGKSGVRETSSRSLVLHESWCWVGTSLRFRCRLRAVRVVRWLGEVYYLISPTVKEKTMHNSEDKIETRCKSTELTSSESFKFDSHTEIYSVNRASQLHLTRDHNGDKHKMKIATVVLYGI